MKYTENNPINHRAKHSTLYVSDGEYAKLLSQKSFYTLPYSLFSVRATYRQVLTYLQEEGVLTHFYLNETRIDFFAHFGFSTYFIGKETPSGHGMATSYAGSHENEIAISKAIGEGLERFMLHAMSNSNVKPLKKFSFEDEAFSHLHSLPHYLPEQNEKHEKLFNKKKDVARLFRATETVDLFTKEKRYLPLQYIFWSRENTEEPTLHSSTTNGAGAHFTKTGAILSGLHEELQRDTFLLYWLSKKTPQKIAISTIQNKEVTTIIQNLESKGFIVHILFLESTYKVPTFISVIEDERNKNSYSIAVGAGTDAGQYEEAIRSALLESISVLPINQKDDLVTPLSTKNGHYFHDFSIDRITRICMWKGEEAKKNIQFFITGKTISLRDISSNELIATGKDDLLEKILPLLRLDFSEVLTYEVNSPLLKKIGYHVVRVFLPEALQLHLIEPLATLRSKRLAACLHKKVEDLKIVDINPLPHLFP